jgi:hypothetical protein
MMAGYGEVLTTRTTQSENENNVKMPFWIGKKGASLTFPPFAKKLKRDRMLASTTWHHVVTIKEWSAVPLHGPEELLGSP